MTDDALTPEQIAAIAAAVDVNAPPPADQPVAMVVLVDVSRLRRAADPLKD